MKVTIVAVGKIREKYIKDGIGEYAKRISRFAKLSIIEVADEKVPDKLSKLQEQEIKEKEGEKILSKVVKDAYVILLDLKGAKLDSLGFAKEIENILCVKGCSHIAFIIGGSIGIGENVKKQANFAVSFSDMTFPHQLMRLILLEQIYRVLKINNNETYHK